MLESRDEEALQHSRDLLDDIKGPREQPRQCDPRLRQQDDWCSEGSDQKPQYGAVRSGNREPRYYRDGEIPHSRMETVSYRPPRREAREEGKTSSSTSVARCGARDEAEPRFSTVLCPARTHTLCHPMMMMTYTYIVPR